MYAGYVAFSLLRNPAMAKEAFGTGIKANEHHEMQEEQEQVPEQL